MTYTSTIEASTTVLKGNSPLHLTHADRLWRVQSGAMAIFAVTIAEGNSQGVRRFLFEANPGDVLVGLGRETSAFEVVAVAYEETILESIPLTDLIPPSPSKTHLAAQFLPLMSAWAKQFAGVFQDYDITDCPIAPQFEDEPSQLLLVLQEFQTNCSKALTHLTDVEVENQSKQFRDRLRLNWQVGQDAINSLTAGFRSQKTGFLPEGDALLMAAGAVGHAVGIKIQPPSRSEDMSRVKDPLDAIARATRIRTRRVILVGKWWNSDCGALLAYTAEGERPVALLPTSQGYEIFDPERSQRFPLTAKTAQTLSPIAYMLYRSLPDQIKKSTTVFRFAVEGRLRDAALMMILGVAGSLLGMVVPQATGILIDKAIPDADRGLLFQIGLGLIGISLGKAAFELGQSIASSRFQALTNAKTQAAVWDRLLKLRVSFFRQYSIGDLQSRVSAITQIRQILGDTVMRTIFTSFFSLLNLGLLFLYSWQLAMVAVGVAIVNILVTNLSSAMTRKQLRPLESLQGELFGLTVQLIGGISKLRVAAAEERAFAYWSKQFSQELKLKMSTEVIEDATQLFNSMLPNIANLLIYILAVYLITTAQAKGGAVLTVGAFMAFNSAFGTFIDGATGLSNAVIDVLEVGVLWERANPILQEVPEINDSKADPGRLTGGIRLDRVSFRYAPDVPLTLDKVSIEAKPGEFIAFVGPSGSGKSTVLRLLLGFEQPEEGTIYYDGQDMAGLDVGMLRRQLGVVLQNGRINSASIFENISGGAVITMDEAWDAARMSGFAQDVEGMPMGMHTVISEGGTNLSGGQRQRLLIARSLVLKPKVLFFDEATSALDNQTQATVTASLDKLKATRIVIAHRLSTIRNADRIYVIAAGQVVQQGGYEELIQQPGLFADLMSRQIA
jgi:NHLM bacteriocin system ABC transporter ATP-binding protein